MFAIPRWSWWDEGDERSTRVPWARVNVAVAETSAHHGRGDLARVARTAVAPGDDGDIGLKGFEKIKMNLQVGPTVLNSESFSILYDVWYISFYF